FHPSACDHSLFLSRLLLPPPASLFPYTTLFRSSGTPTSARPAFTYSIAASNVYGSSVGATLLLTVDPPPAGTAVPAGGGSTVSNKVAPTDEPYTLLAAIEYVNAGLALVGVPEDRKSVV